MKPIMTCLVGRREQIMTCLVGENETNYDLNDFFVSYVFIQKLIVDKIVLSLLAF